MQDLPSELIIEIVSHGPPATIRCMKTLNKFFHKTISSYEKNIKPTRSRITKIQDLFCIRTTFVSDVLRRHPDFFFALDKIIRKEECVLEYNLLCNSQKIGYCQVVSPSLSVIERYYWNSLDGYISIFVAISDDLEMEECGSYSLQLYIRDGVAINTSYFEDFALQESSPDS
jgi:hypothetical protein